MSTLKNILNSLSIIILFIVTSCSNDEPDINQNPENELGANLISITLINSSGDIQVKYIFEQEKLVRTESSTGRVFSTASYSGGFLSKLEEFNENGELKFSHTYAYDELERLINKTTTLHNSFPEYGVTEKKIDYVENKIFLTRNNFHAITNKLNSSNTFEINTNEFGLITNESNGILNIQMIYAQENIINYSVFAEKKVRDVDYSFFDIKATEEFQFHQLMFGKEWKNNFILDKHEGSVGFLNMPLISKSLSKNFTEIHLETQEVQVDLSFSYVFDELGRLKEHIRKNRIGPFSDVRIIYEYGG